MELAIGSGLLHLVGLLTIPAHGVLAVISLAAQSGRRTWSSMRLVSWLTIAYCVVAGFVIATLLGAATGIGEEPDMLALISDGELIRVRSQICAVCSGVLALLTLPILLRYQRFLRRLHQSGLLDGREG